MIEMHTIYTPACSTKLIKLFPLVLVAQHLVGLADLLELFARVLVLVGVGMVFFRQLVVRLK